MRSFNNFLKEATETSASRQAKLLGLVGDGHGGWYDAKGKFVAKTEQGKLKFYGQGGAKPQDDKPAQKKAAEAPTPTKKLKPVQQQQEKPQETEKSQGIVLVFGRFNPPTIGHQKLLQSAQREAKRTNADLKIYPSRTQDPKKNPLDPGMKINFMKQMFPDYEENIIDDAGTKTIFDALVSAYNEKYKNATIVVGQDRLSEFQGLAQKYNGSDLYNFENIVVVSGGARDPDADDVTGMSASKMRAYATDGDFQSFVKGLPPALKTMQKRELFNNVRKSMNIKESLLWEIAPKLDPDTLREEYRNGNILNIGDIVENINTGLHGEIIRRGTNYVICVCENGIMFKSWLKDLQEYTEVKMDSMMRDKIHPNTLVGTKGFLKYLQMMTPGYDKGIKVKNQYK